jgi:hypothetical protein
MRSKTLRLWLLSCALALGGCSRCGKGPAVEAGGLAAHVPQSAQGVLLVPDLARLGEKLTRLQTLRLASFAAQLQGFGSAQAFADALAAQAGVDPRSRESLQGAGLAPERGLAVVAVAPGRSTVVVGVSDAKKFEAWLSTQARNRLGATKTTRVTKDGVEELLFSTQAGAPLLGVAFVDGYALLAQGPDLPGLPAAAQLERAASLARDPAFAAAVKPLPAERDVLAWAPKGSPLLDPTFAGSGAALSLVLGKDALDARLFLPRPDAPKEVRAFQKVEAQDLTWMLDGRSVVRARFSVDPARFAGIWQRYVPGRVNLALTAAGVDVDKEVMGNARAGAVAELSLAQGAQLGAGLPAFDVRRTNPFHYVQLFAALGLKDPKAAEQVVERVAKNAPHFGARMEPTTVSGARAWFTRYARGEGADVALLGDTLILAGPRARMTAALPRVQAGEKAAPDEPLHYQDALTAPAVGFVVDLHQLTESVRALPSSAWGVGGFAIKATTLRWLDATPELAALTGGITGAEGGLVVELSLRFAEK